MNYPINEQEIIDVCTEALKRSNEKLADLHKYIEDSLKRQEMMESNISN